VKRPAVGAGTALIDSHCHLQSLAVGDRAAALDAARSRGVAGFLIPALRLEEAEAILAFCHAQPDVWCALGVHPHEASTWTAKHRAWLSDLVSDPKVVAVGECGLDFHYDLSDRRTQVVALREQWEVALEQNLPVVVHNRDSNETILSLLEEPDFAGLQGDFHSFAGGLEMALSLIASGFYLGFSGMVTFNGAQNVRHVLPRAPRNRILVETDTPYLAPVPYRGRPNRPAYVVEVARRVAAELGTSYEDLCETSSGNFYRLFSKAGKA
jgi:TatD DNase family protein